MDRQLAEVVEAKGRTWGWQWRHTFGKDVSISLASLGAMADRSAPPPGGSYKEVFKGDALEFACALKQLNEKLREFAVIHYVIAEPAKVKAHAMGIHEQTYWQRRNKFRAAIAKWLDI